MRPLEGIKVVEMAGVFAVPYCGMLLADFGADVIVVDRVSSNKADHHFTNMEFPFDRGKRSIRLDLKSPESIEIVKQLISNSDILIEPYRPGVMESLGLGPEVFLKINPGLIYARLTGWGQTGPYAQKAGHDLNYLALSGALSLLHKEGEQPVPPLSFMGDLAGGGLFCAFGIVLALIERSKSGKGQVVDHAMLDGITNLSTVFFMVLKQSPTILDLMTRVLRTEGPYYQCYETSDGKYLSAGPVEERFYGELLEKLGIDPDSLPPHNNPKNWPEITARFRQEFKGKNRDEWVKIFEGSDACVEPVLNLDEAPKHPHNEGRGVFMTKDGIPQPIPVPRLTRTPGNAGGMETLRGESARDILEDLGYSEDNMNSLFERQIVE